VINSVTYNTKAKVNNYIQYNTITYAEY